MRQIRRLDLAAPVSYFLAALGILLSLVAAAQTAERRTLAGAGDIEIPVFYVTNRQRLDDGPGGAVYGGERGEIRYGECFVRFTPIPLIGEVAEKVPFYIPAETKEVRVAEETLGERFWRRLSAAARETETGSVVVFVHGYNHGFGRTCRMAADLQRSLAGEATVLMFSWPSNAGPVEYVRDQADVEWTAPHLAELLGRLAEDIGYSKIQLLAHSLGSRGTLLALWWLAADMPERPLVGRLVFLAPDIDAQSFRALVPRLAPLTAGITVYASSKDAPLKVSRQLSGYPRLGEAGGFLTLVEGVETIDVSSSGRYQITGHEYFYYHPLVKADLVELLTSGKVAAERSGLRERARGGLRYWEVRRTAGD